ncbi:MAG: HD domain-containing protein [Actinobacteria bacterium]|nr:HD domain-containing protein [Actinomycetota bacterium]MCG2807857.1 HD domain-containing protein [Coriobacteriia bacterium]
MKDQDIRGLLKREGQLNAFSYTVIVVLLGMILVLILAAMTGIEIADIWVLGDQIARILFVGLILMFVLYMVDQQRRLRVDLLEAHGELELANEHISAAYERLSFAQHTATLMTSLSETSPLEKVLSDSLRHFGADAAALVGDDVTLIADEGLDAREVQPAIMQVALESVRAGKALASRPVAAGGEAIAVPLRIRGELKSVACLWRSLGSFTSDQLEGLALIARIIELSMENRMLLGEVRDQLSGTLSVLSSLIEQRLPDSRRHGTRIAEYAIGVGKALGLSARETADLRVAALIADVGMLQLPTHLLGVSERDASIEDLGTLRMHPQQGAQVARNANFSEYIQETIYAHHELLDGSGYPRGLKGDQIPLGARVLAVVIAYDSMTSATDSGSRVTGVQAVATIMRGAGRLYDAEIVRAFLQVVGHDMSCNAAGPADTDPSCTPTFITQSETGDASVPAIAPIISPVCELVPPIAIPAYSAEAHRAAL